MEAMIRISVSNATAEDYFELEEILRHGNLDAKLHRVPGTGAEMGFEIEQLIVLIPVLLPYVEQLSKVLIAYFQYRQPRRKKTSITLEYGDKKVIIESENTKIPDVNELMTTLFNVEA